MALSIEPNLQLLPGTDKMGHFLMTLKNRLVATGLYRVRGSGDGNRPSGGGVGANFQYMGVTAGPYDVFTLPPQTNATDKVFGAAFHANSISNGYAWFVLEEIASGRCFLFQRSNASEASEVFFSVEFAPGGYNPAGCDARTVPLPIGTAKILAGQRQLTTATGFAPARYIAGSAYDFHGSGRSSEWAAKNSTTVVAQIWVPDSSRAGNVAPFIAVTLNKGTPAMGGMLCYESLVDAPSNEPVPAVLVCTQWSDVISLFNGNTGPNVSPASRPVAWVGGPSLDGVNAEPCMGQNLGRSPGHVSRPVDSDSLWRTFRPRVHVSPYSGGSYRLLGRLEHLYSNMVNREYPTTYNIAGPQAYVTLSILIAPWKVGVAPTWGP